jgi:hypothetical protein
MEVDILIIKNSVQFSQEMRKKESQQWKRRMTSMELVLDTKHSLIQMLLMSMIHWLRYVLSWPVEEAEESLEWANSSRYLMTTIADHLISMNSLKQ